MNFLLILSHKKSTVREDQRRRILASNNGKFIFYYFIGDESLKTEYEVDEENNIVYLKVGDNYESLSMKVYKAMKFISKNYMDRISGVFKTDDDIILDIDKLFDCVNNNRSNPYFGLEVNSKSYESTYHYGKCDSVDINRTPIRIPDCNYCAGGGYYISRDSIKYILNSKDIYQSIIFEDVSTGIAMNRNGIFPTNIDIKRSGCIWGKIEEDVKRDNITYFKIPNRNPGDLCVCGHPKNRMKSNFCQKCNKLY
jgi:hypothetical protein